MLRNKTDADHDNLDHPVKKSSPYFPTINHFGQSVTFRPFVTDPEKPTVTVTPKVNGTALEYYAYCVIKANEIEDIIKAEQNRNRRKKTVNYLYSMHTGMRDLRDTFSSQAYSDYDSLYPYAREQKQQPETETQDEKDFAVAVATGVFNLLLVAAPQTRYLISDEKNKLFTYSQAFDFNLEELSEPVRLDNSLLEFEKNLELALDATNYDTLTIFYVRDFSRKTEMNEKVKKYFNEIIKSFLEKKKQEENHLIAQTIQQQMIATGLIEAKELENYNSYQLEEIFSNPYTLIGINHYKLFTLKDILDIPIYYLRTLLSKEGLEIVKSGKTIEEAAEWYTPEGIKRIALKKRLITLDELKEINEFTLNQLFCHINILMVLEKGIITIKQLRDLNLHNLRAILSQNNCLEVLSFISLKELSKLHSTTIPILNNEFALKGLKEGLFTLEDIDPIPENFLRPLLCEEGINALRSGKIIQEVTDYYTTDALQRIAIKRNLVTESELNNLPTYYKQEIFRNKNILYILEKVCKFSDLTKLSRMVLDILFRKDVINGLERHLFSIEDLSAIPPYFLEKAFTEQGFKDLEAGKLIEEVAEWHHSGGIERIALKKNLISTEELNSLSSHERQGIFCDKRILEGLEQKQFTLAELRQFPSSSLRELIFHDNFLKLLSIMREKSLFNDVKNIPSHFFKNLLKESNLKLLVSGSPVEEAAEWNWAEGIKRIAIKKGIVKEEELKSLSAYEIQNIFSHQNILTGLQTNLFTLKDLIQLSTKISLNIYSRHIMRILQISSIKELTSVTHAQMTLDCVLRNPSLEKALQLKYFSLSDIDPISIYELDKFNEDSLKQCESGLSTFVHLDKNTRLINAARDDNAITRHRMFKPVEIETSSPKPSSIIQKNDNPEKLQGYGCIIM